MAHDDQDSRDKNQDDTPWEEAVKRERDDARDDNGDEDDGFDEFLVVHDSSIENLAAIRSSVLLDDAFGRWLQILDGREIIVSFSDEFAQSIDLISYL